MCRAGQADCCRRPNAPSQDGQCGSSLRHSPRAARRCCATGVEGTCRWGCWRSAGRLCRRRRGASARRPGRTRAGPGTGGPPCGPSRSRSGPGAVGRLGCRPATPGQDSPQCILHAQQGPGLSLWLQQPPAPLQRPCSVPETCHGLNHRRQPDPAAANCPAGQCSLPSCMLPCRPAMSMHLACCHTWCTAAHLLAGQPGKAPTATRHARAGLLAAHACSAGDAS